MVKINFMNFLKKITIFFIKLYQNIFSLTFGHAKCRFYPTCSCYMIEAINKKGLIKGIFSGILRILRCHPFSKKNSYDPVE